MIRRNRGPDTTAPALARRGWVPEVSETYVQQVAAGTANAADPGTLADEIEALARRNREIHDRECVNLNPAANTMNPRAEALLSSGLGARPSLGYPAGKYEMGLAAIERIEVIAAELAAEVFHAAYAEVRTGSGALANLYVFMATCRPGDAIIAPPPEIGGHVTHHAAGGAGRYGLVTHPAPIDPGRYTVDVDALASLVRSVRPALITVGGSLNLTHHPVALVREIADEVGAVVMFDAAHLSGPIAGGAWPNPLDEGAHVMTMSAYKSLAGPPSGLLVTNDAEIAERVDSIAYPGLTANFDAANTAALAITLLDWQRSGDEYAAAMVSAAQRLAERLAASDVPVFGSSPFTRSHAFALDAGPGGGHAAAIRLAAAGLLTSAIGLPHGAADGVRVGANETVRWGIEGEACDELADLVARAWHASDPTALAGEVTAFRQRFLEIRYAH
jgi:glycine hydroxymethyltransferase